MQTFVQEMLPKDDDLFGDAASADAYRGMMAEQLADQLARSGGVGIAKMIEKAQAARSSATPPHAHGPRAAAPPVEAAASAPATPVAGVGPPAAVAPVAAGAPPTEAG